MLRCMAFEQNTLMTAYQQFHCIIYFLHTQEVDMVVAPVARQRKREMYMDFTEVPFYLEFTTVALRKPDPDDNTVGLFFQPFKLEMWVCIMAAVPVVAVVVWLYSCTNGAILFQTQKSTKLHNVVDTLWFSLGAIFNQGEGMYVCAYVHNFICLRTYMRMYDGIIVCMCICTHARTYARANERASVGTC